MARNDDFFETQRVHSLIKTRIVIEYFKQWSRIMVGQMREKANPRISYLDLFCGPGRYDDGTPSTPLQLMTHAIANPDLCEMLVAAFNDIEPDHIRALTKNLEELPGYKNIKNKPLIRCGEIDRPIVERWKGMNLVPTFSFLDPFGYKGLTLELVDALVKSWGCDMVLFFSFNSINRSLTIPAVKKHIDSLFGEKRADELRVAAQQVEAEKREELLIEKFIEAINDLGYPYVIPYMVERDDRARTSHYLIFITKHQLGFGIMKEIMYALSEDKTQGVARFGYVGAVSRKRTPLLDLFNRPLDKFADDLCVEYAGQTKPRKDFKRLYDRNYARNPYVDKNWREVLERLELAGFVEANPPHGKRPKRKGVVTFGENTIVTFMPKGAL